MHFFLAVDVETYSGDYERDIFAGGLGLDYLLGRCNHYGIPGTYFVEALGATKWGSTGLREVCRRVNEAGQDVQLHLHPEVARVQGLASRSFLFSYTRAEQSALIATGRDILAACGVREIVALRAGDLAADENTMRAMADCGLRISSNRDLDTKSSVCSRVNDYFPVVNDLSRVGAVVDLPVSCLRSPVPFLDGRYRHFNITAVGSLELREALAGMYNSGYATATVLTHPQEFFTMTGGIARPNGKNCRRLEKLLHLVANSSFLRAATVGECAGGPFPAASPPEISGSALGAGVRVLSQGISRIPRFHLGRGRDVRRESELSGL